MAATKTPTSPKVTVSTVTGAATVVVLYLLGQIPVFADLNETVKGAILVIVTAGLTYAAGWLKSDPLRKVVAQYGGKHSA